MTQTARCIKVVCDFYGIHVRRLLDGGTTPRAAGPRAVAAWLLRYCARLSFPAISSALGWEHHTSAMDACRRVFEREELRAAALAMLEWLEAGVARRAA